MITDEDIEKISTALSLKFPSKQEIERGFEKMSMKFETLSDTLDHLAILTKKGFDETEENFKDSDIRFNKQDEILFAMDSKIGSMDKEFKSVEKVIEPFATEHKVIMEEIKKMDTRIFKIEKNPGLAAT